MFVKQEHIGKGLFLNQTYLCNFCATANHNLLYPTTVCVDVIVAIIKFILATCRTYGFSRRFKLILFLKILVFKYNSELLWNVQTQKELLFI